MEILKALSQMQSIQQDLVAAPHVLHIADPGSHLRDLASEIRRLEAVIDCGSPPKPPIDPHLVWRKWERAGFAIPALDRREWRSLCVSPDTAARPKLVAALQQDPTPLQRFSTLMGFVHVYFALWREIDKPDSMEALIRSALEHENIRRRGRVVACWRSSPFLFTSVANARLAEHVVRGNTSPDKIREQFYLQKGSRLMRSATECAAEQLVGRLVTNASTLSQNAALEQIRFLSESLLEPSFQEVPFRDLLSRLILSELPIRLPAVQSMLVQWIHDDPRLGDPRLGNCAPNWRKVDPAARARFLTWLAKETLEFFFNTIVPENDENRRRATFWIDYARRGLIRDFNVVVARQDEWRMRSSRTKFIPSYARLDANESGQTSAFLMVFEGYGREYVVAEFSETGNAAHICQRSLFESGGVKLHNTLFRRKEIHNPQRAELRINHVGYWESRASGALASQLGIRI
jgi:hypothetical protein